MNNGPGVGDTKRVFQPGYTSKPLGTGMGLIICRQLVALHEGRLSLRRPEEGGAELVISLPRAGEAALARASLHPHALSQAPQWDVATLVSKQ